MTPASRPNPTPPTPGRSPQAAADAAGDDSAGNSGGGWLLVSDVDATLTGDDAALARLAQAIATRSPRLTVSLNSSRPADSVDRTVREVLPAGFTPDATITAMGTQVRVGGRWVDEWTRRFDGWPRDAIAAVVTALGHPPHDDEFQTAHKASFAVPRGEAQDAVAEELRRRQLPCRIIASGSDDLDLLPPGGGKDHATRFLAEHLGLDAATRLVVAGDSANDLAMFHAAPRAIAVGNARPELVEAMDPATSYHAAAHCAAGVIEGLEHYGVWAT